MKRCFYALLLLLPVLPAQAQTLYKDFEVDSAARPIGGIPLLEKFIDVNRRMPYAAEVSRTKGIVILSGVIEPNGTVSEIKTLRSLRPDCDREAIRVLSLFNAWKPALKDGKPVRQSFTYPVRFTPSVNKSEPGAITTYYSKEGNWIADETQAAFRLVTPVDTNGLPNGNPVISERKGTNWKKSLENSFEKIPYTQSNEDDPSLPDSIQAIRLAIKDPLFKFLNGTIYSLYPNGMVMAKELYDDGKRIGQSIYYYANGVVKRIEEPLPDGKIQEWSWFRNGQLQQVLMKKAVPLTTDESELLSQWDSTGKQLVQNGNGMARFISKQDSKWVTETGLVKERRKEGIWLGRFNDGKLAYREVYQGGKCSSGVAYYDQDSVAYTEPWQNPEFKGGMKGLGSFLSSTIRYPVEASRAKIQGKVFVTFVVCQDGSLCDYEIIRSVHPTVDQEALRVVKASNGKWKPGAVRGKKVRVKYNLPINFALQ
ncbi:hypothetical protein GCM10028803_53810 [Larkinella knui]|uniref:TonB family protein n=1 Tax=Larkinella knui TaxID=2025310 RepID=A0A3P1CGD1_9BACT|nr:TonB family protein [Larkinella knui]RRB12413.1 TonB family protein [Larkinella knui]